MAQIVEPQPAIRITTDADNVRTVVMDLPGKPVNICSTQLLAELADAVTAIERDKPAAVIFASAKQRSFNAGADLAEMRGMDRSRVAEYLANGQSLFERIARLPMPTVAAINGDSLGGGFELALACRYRVAAESTAISIGLPEVKLGLIPAWGGTTRLPRLIGLRAALPILLAGKTLPPRKALRAGLIDETVRPETLLAAARRIALSQAKPHGPPPADQALVAIPFARNRYLNAVERQTRATTSGNYPAPMGVIQALRAGYDQSHSAGLEAERKIILDLIDTPAGQNLLRLFFLRQGAKKEAASKAAAKPRDINQAAVIGGGTMGAGIAYSLIRAGIPVRLVEVNPQAVSAALGRIKAVLDEDVAAGRIDQLTSTQAFDRLSPTSEWVGLDQADIVIEAVLETIETKRDVFARLDRLTRPTAVLASNTSSLRIAEMAQATANPGRVVGLHFFNPVPKMPLVEVVRGPLSDEPSLATAVALAGRVGKTPIVVADSPGFLVNRILIPYLVESLILASEGAPIDAIDDAMKRWGMPMGPFELLDEIGLDICAHIFHVLCLPAPPPPHVTSTLDLALGRKWLGRKTGSGFYTRVPARRRGRPARLTMNTELFNALAAGGRKPVPDDPAALEELRQAIQWRLVLPMVNEAARALEEGVTDSTDAIDLSTVLGLGLAPFRGGIMRFANAVGAELIVRRLDELAGRLGPRFAPAELLRNAARSHGPIARAASISHPQTTSQSTRTTV